MQFKNIGEFISLISELKKFDTIEDAFDNANDTFAKLTQTLDKTPELSKYLKNLDFGDEIIGYTNVADKIQDIGTASTGVIGKVKALGTALKGAIVAHPIMAAIAAITTAVGVGVTAWMNYQQSIKEAVENAQVAGDAWSKQNDTLEEQKTKVQELREQLASGNLSEQETYNIKTQILDIQNQIVEQYGAQSKGINLVNGDLEKQLSLLDQINVSEAQRTYNENSKGFDKAIEEMEKEDTYYLGPGGTYGTDLSKRIEEIANQYNGISLDKSPAGTYHIEYYGTAAGADENINNFITDLRSLQDEFGEGTWIDDIIASSEKALNEAGSIVDEYKDVYEEGMAAQLAFKDDGKGLATLKEYTDAIEEYNSALASGDENQIASSKEVFDTVSNSVDELVAKYPEFQMFFDDVSKTLDTDAISANEFTKQLTQTYKGLVESIASENLDDVDLKAMAEGALPAWDRLKQAAEDHKVGVDDLIALLIELNAVQSQATGETPAAEAPTFSSIMGDPEGLTAQIDEYQDKLSSLSSVMEQLKSGELTGDALADLYQQLPELAESADSLDTALAKLNVNTTMDMLAALDGQIKSVEEAGGDIAPFEKFRQSLTDAFDPAQYNIEALKDAISDVYTPDVDFAAGIEKDLRSSKMKNDFREMLNSFSDEEVKIVSKLMLDPESAQWTLDEWKANVESEKITLGVDLEDTPALDAYRKAQESTNQGDRYLEMLDAYEKGAELYKQGLVGTDDFKTIASMFSANGMDDVANWEENVGKIERYMTEDSTGVKNFLNDLTTKTTEAGEALASYNSQTGEWSLNLDDLEANARSMGMSFEWFTSMLGRLEDYNFNLNTFGNVEDGVDKLTELYGDLASENAKLDELQQRKLQGDTSVTDTVISQQQAKIDGIKEQILGAEDLLDQLMNKSLQDYEQEAYGAGEMVKNLLEYRDQTSSSAVKGMLTDQIKELADTYHLDLVFDTEGNITDVVLPEVSAAQDALNQNPLKVSVDEGFLNKVDTGVKANEDSLQGDFDTLGKYSASDIASINFGDGISDAGFEEAEAAVDHILKTLGLSQDEAYALVQALSELGYINLKVENPQQIPEDVQQAIEDNPIVFDNLDSSTITDDFISKVQSGVQSAGDSLQQYINTLKNYTPEEIATIDFNDGDYTEGLEAAESAVDGIADALGVSRDEAAALVEVLAQLGVIQFKAEVENPEAPAAQIQETADQQPIEYKANIELQETPLLPGTENITIQPKADESDTKVTITADNQPALDAIDEVGTYAKNSDAEVSLTANNQSIMDMVEEFNVQAGASEPIQIKASNEQAIGTLNETKEKIDDTTGTMDIDGNNQGAIASANSANTYIKGLNPDIHIGGDTSGLTTDINNSLSGTFKIRLSPVMMLGGIQGQAAGTAHAAGTIPGQVTPGLALWNNYRASIGAYAYGNDWSLNRDEDALVNELGTESIVRDGKWFPIPGGAHVEHLKRNDIIFNADQTKELIKTGRVISGGGHGRVIGSAYAQGTADRILNAYAVGNGGGGFAAGAATGEDGSGLDGAGQAITDFTNALDKGTGATQNNTDSTKKDTEEKEKSIETFDHIQTLLGRLSSKFEELGASLTEFSSRAKQTSVALKQMSNTKQQYNANARAMKEYAREAEGVTYTKTENDQEVTYALPEEWKQKIRHGAFSIEDVDFTDNEELKEAIEEYQEWYEKMLDCRQAMEELKAQQVELYDQWLQIPLDAVNNKIEKYTSNLNNVSSATEALITNNSEAVQSILALSSAGQQALDNLGYGMVVEGEYSPKEQIQIANSSVVDDVKTKKKIANEAKKAAKRTNAAASAQEKNYQTASKNVKSRAEKILDKNKDSLSKEQKEALENGDSVSLTGVDPNSKLYNSLTAYNRLVDTRDVAEEKRNVARQKQTEANQTYDEAVSDWATAKAEAPAKKLQNISDAYDAQRQYTASQIEIERTKNLSDTDKVWESDYDNIISLADQDAMDAKAQADAYEQEMNRQIRHGNLSGAARQEAENTLLNLRNEQRQAEDTALNYRLEAKEVNVTQKNRESQKANTAIETAQAEMELKRSRGGKITASDYKTMQKNANKDIGIQQDTINQLTELQSMVDRGSDKWREYQDQIDSANEAILQQKQNLEDWKDEIDQIKIDDLQLVVDEAQRTTAEHDAERQLWQTEGYDLGKADYETMISDSQREQAAQENLRAELLRQQSETTYGGDEWKELQSQIDACDSSIRQAEQDQLEYNIAMNNLPITRLENELDLLDAIAAARKSEIDLKTARGEDLQEEDYRMQMQDNIDQIDNLVAQRREVFKKYQQAIVNGGAVDGKSADEWKQQYLGLDTEINNTMADNEALKDSLRDDVYFREFDRAREATQAIRDTLQDIKGLINEDMLFDDDGKMTDMGIASMALSIKDMETAREDVQTAMDEIARIRSLKGSDGYSELEYTEDLRNAEEELRNAINNTAQARNEVMDIIKKQAEIELNAIMDVIDARKDALNAKKEYYDYDKQLKSQTKEVNLLKQQIAALDGVTDAESRARKAQLEAELAEAEDTLDETVQEHVYNLKIEGLDNLKVELQEDYDDYIKALNTNLDLIVQMVDESTNKVAGSLDATTKALNDLLASFGVSGLDVSDLSSDVSGKFAQGTKKVTRSGMYLTDEEGPELIVTDQGIIRPLSYGDGVVPANLTERLMDMATLYPNIPAQVIQPQLNVSGSDSSPTVNIHYDSMLNVEGNVDKNALPDLNRLLDMAYERTSKKLTEDFRKFGFR